MRFSKREGDEGGSRDGRRRSRERAREARKRREEIERRARELAVKAPPPKEAAANGAPKPDGAQGKAGAKAEAKAGSDSKPAAERERSEAKAKAERERERDEAKPKAKPKRERGEAKAKGARGDRPSARESARGLARRFSLPGAGRPLRKVGRVASRGLAFLAFLVLWLAARVEKLLAALAGFFGPRLRRGTDWLGRVATPPRVAIVVAVAAGAAALASQAIDYRAVAIGEAAYADVTSLAQAPLTGQEAPWGAHGPLVGLLALVACVGAVLALLKEDRRAGKIALGAAAFALLLILAIDLPRVSDLGKADDEYAGTDGVLLKGFYIQLNSVLLLLFCAALPWLWRIPLPSLARPGSRRSSAPDSATPRTPGPRKAT